MVTAGMPITVCCRDRPGLEARGGGTGVVRDSVASLAGSVIVRAALLLVDLSGAASGCGLCCPILLSLVVPVPAAAGTVFPVVRTLSGVFPSLRGVLFGVSFGLDWGENTLSAC